MEMVIKIILKERAILLNLKTRHLYNALDAKGIGTISENVE